MLFIQHHFYIMNNTESITKSKEDLKEFDAPLIGKKASQTKKDKDKESDEKIIISTKLEKKVEVNQLPAEANLTDINVK